MASLTNFLKKYEIGLQILLLLLAGIFFSLDIRRPLIDYDEATYAKVTVDTLHTGNFLNLQMNGSSWFEKPPLYFWLTIGSVKVFGETELAFRFIGILAAILCCILVYQIVRELTGDILAAAIGFLVLTFSNSFFLFAREARLDALVTAAILASLFFYIKSWKNEKYLLWVLPTIAVGFLFKSVIVFFAIFAILLYSLSYKKWSYIKSKYFWWGSLLALVVFAPWHVVETIRFGKTFWDSYLGVQIFQRAAATVTGTNNFYDYLILIVPWYLPWNIVFFAEILTLFAIRKHAKAFARKEIFRGIIVPFVFSFFIVVTFTSARTHLGPYILPAFPFFAMSIAMSWYYLSTLLPKYRNLFAGLMVLPIIAGAAFCVYLMPAKVPPYTYDERAIGQIYKDQKTKAPLYTLDWLATETINYYGDTHAQPLNPVVVSGQTFKGPFYISVTPMGASYFFSAVDSPKYPGMKLLYIGTTFAFIYAAQDVQMPVFGYQK